MTELDSKALLLRGGERLDDLQLDGLKVIQNQKLYSFTSDAVFLANYVSGVKDKIVVDLGTGSGIIPILVAKKQKPEKIYAIELQECLADMATRSVEYNGMNALIEIINRNMLEAVSILGHESADVVLCNPPYRKCGSGETQAEPHIAMCRHEITINLESIVDIASRLLKSKGSFYAVLCVERMAELFYLLKQHSLEPKEIKFSDNGKCDTFAIKAIKHGGVGLKVIMGKS